MTLREYLNDYASAETRRIGEQLIEKELREIEGMSFFTDKKLLPTFLNYYKIGRALSTKYSLRRSTPLPIWIGTTSPHAAVWRWRMPNHVLP